MNEYVPAQLKNLNYRNDSSDNCNPDRFPFKPNPCPFELHKYSAYPGSLSQSCEINKADK